MSGARYKRVPVLRPGRFIDEAGRAIEITAAALADLALAYDPARHRAPLTLDHAQSGPAAGGVDALGFDGQLLYADLSGIADTVADEIDAGRLAGRSAELYADYDGRGPYLRALSLLGAHPPAVNGLPTWPARDTAADVAEIPPAATASPVVSRTEHTAPAASKLLHSCHRQQLNIIRQQTFHTFSLSEVTMPNTATQPAAAEEDSIRLAEENRRLSDENRSLKAERLQRETLVFLSELRSGGQLTPAMEQAGLEEALLAAADSGMQLRFPDGRVASLAEVLRQVLRALPVSFCCSRLADSAAEPPRLSADEQRIAEQLGLSAEEFASIKSDQ